MPSAGSELPLSRVGVRASSLFLLLFRSGLDGDMLLLLFRRDLINGADMVEARFFAWEDLDRTFGVGE